jgi:hypothetical protein
MIFNPVLKNTHLFIEDAYHNSILGLFNKAGNIFISLSQEKLMSEILEVPLLIRTANDIGLSARLHKLGKQIHLVGVHVVVCILIFNVEHQLSVKHRHFAIPEVS